MATRLVLVCNPNNPTSTALPLSDIAAFVAEVPRHVCVVLDEAYCEFSLLDDPDDSIELLARHPNLVLLRTFSKVYGLCGLRVGFALCGSEELPRAVDLVRQPFHSNAAAQAAAVEALKHQDVVADRVTRTIAERLAMEEALQGLGLHVAPLADELLLAAPRRRPRRAGHPRRPRAARRDRAQRRGARPRGNPARHLRHRRREPALPAGAGRTAVNGR